MADPGTVSAFLAELPADRRREVNRVRDVVRAHLPKGYEEVVSRKMLVYQVPLARYPDTYNGHPLWYVAIASEKSYLSLHLMSVYAGGSPLKRIEDGFRAAGKRLKMGKSCVHFAAADDLALDVIGEVIGSVSVEQWIAIAKAARSRSGQRRV
jgi:hypothetical protein